MAAGGFLLWFYNRPQAALTDCNGVEVYDLADFVSEGAGANKACLAIGRYTTADLQSLGMPNDSIASMIVDSGFRAKVYLDDNFTGTSAIFTADLNNLGSFTTGGTLRTDWDDKISSIEVEAAPACGIAVYDGANYNNWGACLEVGDYNITQLTAKAIPDNTIASIKVNPGFQALVYVDNNFTGNQLQVTTSLVNLDLISGGGESRWDDKISSIKVSAVSQPSPTASNTPIPTTVSILANDKDGGVTVTSGANVTLKWYITPGSTPEPWVSPTGTPTPWVSPIATGCTASPDSGWFNGNLTGTATVKPTTNTTYQLTCGDISDKVAVSISTATATTSTSTTPTTTATASASASVSASVSVSATTTRTAITLANPTISNTRSGSTAGTGSAKTGPETPLVAGGALTLIFASYFVVKKYLG